MARKLSRVPIGSQVLVNIKPGAWLEKDRLGHWAIPRTAKVPKNGDKGDAFGVLLSSSSSEIVVLMSDGTATIPVAVVSSMRMFTQTGTGPAWWVRVRL